MDNKDAIDSIVEMEERFFYDILDIEKDIELGMLILDHVLQGTFYISILYVNGICDKPEWL